VGMVRRSPAETLDDGLPYLPRRLVDALGEQVYRRNLKKTQLQQVPNCQLQPPRGSRELAAVVRGFLGPAPLGQPVRQREAGQVVIRVGTGRPQERLGLRVLGEVGHGSLPRGPTKKQPRAQVRDGVTCPSLGAMPAPPPASTSWPSRRHPS